MRSARRTGPGRAAEFRYAGYPGFNAMMTHRLRVAQASEVDKDLVDWLKKAYTAAGGPVADRQHRQDLLSIGNPVFGFSFRWL